MLADRVTVMVAIFDDAILDAELNGWEDELQQLRKERAMLVELDEGSEAARVRVRQQVFYASAKQDVRNMLEKGIRDAKVRTD